MLFNRRAQSATELAVLGSLVIVAFAFLINYSEKLNRQQAYIQQTFRLALLEARTANNSAAYTKVAFRRMPNVGNPMELGQLQSFSNSSNVLWADGKSTDPHGVTKYQLNEAAALTIPYRATPVNTTETNTSEFTNDMSSTTTFVKNENAGVGPINTTKVLTAQDHLIASVTISGAVHTFDHYLRVGGKYDAGAAALIRAKNRQ